MEGKEDGGGGMDGEVKISQLSHRKKTTTRVSSEEIGEIEA